MLSLPMGLVLSTVLRRERCIQLNAGWHPVAAAVVP